MENVSADQETKKPQPEDYDLVILGSGAGSKLTAWTLAEQGQRVAMIERKYIQRIVPEHRLYAQQEYRSQCEGRFVPRWMNQRDVSHP